MKSVRFFEDRDHAHQAAKRVHLAGSLSFRESENEILKPESVRVFVHQRRPYLVPRAKRKELRHELVPREDIEGLGDGAWPTRTQGCRGAEQPSPPERLAFEDRISRLLGVRCLRATGVKHAIHDALDGVGWKPRRDFKLRRLIDGGVLDVPARLNPTPVVSNVLLLLLPEEPADGAQERTEKGNLHV